MTNEKAVKVTPKVAETRYSYDEVVGASKVFGVDEYTMVGALHPPKKDYTKKEVEQLVRKFQNKEVK